LWVGACRAQRRPPRRHRPAADRPPPPATRCWDRSPSTRRTCMKPSGTLHLIPVGLGDAPVSAWLPSSVQELAGRLTTYIAENAKTARAFLKLVGTAAPLQEITIHTLGPKTDAREIRQWLELA